MASSAAPATPAGSRCASRACCATATTRPPPRPTRSAPSAPSAPGRRTVPGRRTRLRVGVPNGTKTCGEPLLLLVAALGVAAAERGGHVALLRRREVQAGRQVCQPPRPALGGAVRPAAGETR